MTAETRSSAEVLREMAAKDGLSVEAFEGGGAHGFRLVGSGGTVTDFAATTGTATDDDLLAQELLARWCLRRLGVEPRGILVA